jgi:hypothetical protein
MSTAAPPVVTKVVFKDEGRDVLGDVLKDPSKQALSGETGTYFEPVAEQPPADAPPVAPPKEDAPVVSTEAAPPPTPTLSTSTAPPAAPADEKLYAGKFKTPEDLAKGYEELQKSFTTKAQEAASARKALEEREKAAPKTPEETEAERLTRINEMLTDPDGYFRKQAEKASEIAIVEAKNARDVAAKVEAWRTTNKDVAPYEDYIGVVMQRLTAADPSLDPMAALERATTAVREDVGKIREAGKLEALAIQGSVTQTSAAKVNTPPPTEQPSSAPVTDEQARNQHLDFLKSQAAGVRRQVR